MRHEVTEIKTEQFTPYWVFSGFGYFSERDFRHRYGPHPTCTFITVPIKPEMKKLLSILLAAALLLAVSMIPKESKKQLAEESNA